MTTTIETDVNASAVAEWLADLSELRGALRDNPGLIEPRVGMSTALWLHGSHKSQREQVQEWEGVIGPFKVVEEDHSWVQLVSTRFGVHSIRLYVDKVAIGHKTQDAIPERWEWDALGEQSCPA